VIALFFYFNISRPNLFKGKAGQTGSLHPWPVEQDFLFSFSHSPFFLFHKYIFLICFVCLYFSHFILIYRNSFKKYICWVIFQRSTVGLSKHYSVWSFQSAQQNNNDTTLSLGQGYLFFWPVVQFRLVISDVSSVWWTVVSGWNCNEKFFSTYHFFITRKLRFCISQCWEKKSELLEKKSELRDKKSQLSFILFYVEETSFHSFVVPLKIPQRTIPWSVLKRTFFFSLSEEHFNNSTPLLLITKKEMRENRKRAKDHVICLIFFCWLFEVHCPVEHGSLNWSEFLIRSERSSRWFISCSCSTKPA